MAYLIYNSKILSNKFIQLEFKEYKIYSIDNFSTT